MSVYNPQRLEISRILSGIPLASYRIQESTEYYFEKERVVCLGTYGLDGVAVFGEWGGSLQDAPRVFLEDIGMSSHAFLLRPTTEEEVLHNGFRKALVSLEVYEVVYAKIEIEKGVYTQDRAEKIVFVPKRNTGFYNPLV